MSQPDAVSSAICWSVGVDVRGQRRRHRLTDTGDWLPTPTLPT
jgi:hypothetical protein